MADTLTAPSGAVFSWTAAAIAATLWLPPTVAAQQPAVPEEFVPPPMAAFMLHPPQKALSLDEMYRQVDEAARHARVSVDAPVPQAIAPAAAPQASGDTDE